MDARALIAYVGFYPVIRESGEHAALPSLCGAKSTSRTPLRARDNKER
jgi:hypothetical protein